jgi:hypothetical protein
VQQPGFLASVVLQPEACAVIERAVLRLASKAKRRTFLRSIARQQTQPLALDFPEVQFFASVFCGLVTYGVRYDFLSRVEPS